MKRNFVLILFFLAHAVAFGQAPYKMSYQAVVRNDANVLVSNQTVGMQISILQGEEGQTVVYAETHSPVANDNGLVSFEIGMGTVISGDFAAIDWSAGPYYIKIEADPEGGSSYSVTGISQLVSVPYALHAATAESLSGALEESDPIFAGSPAFTISNETIANWNAAFFWGNHTQAGYLTSFTENDPLFLGSPAFGISLPNISNWNTAFSWGDHSLAGYLTSFTESDPLFGASAAFGIAATDISNWNTAFGWGNHALAGYLTEEVDGSVTNELQTLSFSDHVLSLTNGGEVTFPVTVENVLILSDSLYVSFTNGQTLNAGYVGPNTPGSTLPSVSTTTVNGISYRGATATGEVGTTGNELVVARGFVYATTPLPTLSNAHVLAGGGLGTFSAELTGLLPNTLYYARAFATNTLGTSYGSAMSFTTLALTTPVLTTTTVSNISHTTAQGGGNITDDGGSALTARGICWSVNNNPTIADAHTDEGTEPGAFVSLLAGLTPATQYFVRAYATNAQGTAYGNEVSFTTNTLALASITTNNVSAVSYTSATSGGNVTSDNGSAVTSRGICWATTPAPTTANFNVSQAGGLGTFSLQMTGLTPATTYYVRAFAVNGAGTVYGNEYSFTTTALSAPALTTKAITGISSNIAGSGGTITSDGGSNITAKGVVWSLNPTPTLANFFTNDGAGAASYNSTMNNLNPLTTYYVRAYATNSLGTTYGNQLSFTTTDLVNPGPTVPTIGTQASAMTSTTTASSGGYISQDGGSPVTARGVCWSTSQNPTLADQFSEDGTGTGFFSSTVTDLSGCGTVYYIRAYATNSTGTGYGNQVTVSTGLVGTVTTADITNIEYYTATAGGNVTDDGNCSVTQKGVCWSINPNPTTGNWNTQEGPGSGPFVSSITGLMANKTYYVRAYVTNSVGTTYGEEKVFTTATPSTPYIGQNYAGGIIFYLDETGEHGLVVSPSDLGSFQWGCYGADIPGTSTAMGTGAVNTAAIVAGCSQDNIAAKACDNLSLNGYSDWFLPSRGELALIFQNLYQHGLGGNLNNYYWSSSQMDIYHASVSYPWGMDFWPKNHSYPSVRAVRAF
jgi:hypothetical protein